MTSDLLWRHLREDLIPEPTLFSEKEHKRLSSEEIGRAFMGLPRFRWIPGMITNKGRVWEVSANTGDLRICNGSEYLWWNLERHSSLYLLVETASSMAHLEGWLRELPWVEALAVKGGRSGIWEYSVYFPSFSHTSSHTDQRMALLRTAEIATITYLEI